MDDLLVDATTLAIKVFQRNVNLTSMQSNVEMYEPYAVHRASVVAAFELEKNGESLPVMPAYQPSSIERCMVEGELSLSKRHLFVSLFPHSRTVTQQYQTYFSKGLQGLRYKNLYRGKKTTTKTEHPDPEDMNHLVF